jgi:formamidopyrimidine-DNA glycosylase
MPELPEVETICRDLKKSVKSKEIVDIKVSLEKSFINPQGEKICGKISDIRRVGKYILIDIAPKYTLITHLRMTGKLVYQSPAIYPTKKTEKHIRVVFCFSTGDSLYFHDVRTFGQIEVSPYHTDIYRLKNLGVDALEPAMSIDYFQKLCRGKKIPIKQLLLDQNIIAGIGNIYAQEILFSAGVSPLRIANTLCELEIQKTYKSTISILKLAIKYNGTSISDFRRVDDKTGKFQNFLKVYGKKICPICESELIIVRQGGRTGRYCRYCQK